MLENLGALAGIREGEGLTEVLQGGVGTASGREAGAEEFKGGEDFGGAHVFVLTTADGVGEVHEGGALFVKQVEGVAVAAEGQVVLASLLTEVFHIR